MRIGILTFHSEINYGSVLQALALQTHLQSLGHDVVIIDKWENSNNWRLRGPFVRRSPLFWIKYLCHGLLLSGSLGRIMRHIKTFFLIRRYLKLTPYKFFTWKDAPKDLGVDIIIVGSDQVWNPIIVDPPDYLLKWVPKDIPGIAYAASIGQHELDAKWRDEYVEGFQRFVAIGVREAEAKRLVESTGASATHVVDPTLLVDAEKCWRKFIGHGKSKRGDNRERLFCYLMTHNVSEILPCIVDFAKKNHAVVDVLLNDQLLPTFDKKLKDFKKWMNLHSMLIGSGVRIHFSAAPDDFVRLIAQATCVLTESFHGLMFSIIFRKNVRVVINRDDPCRMAMSSRMMEFSGSVAMGPLICNTFDAALQSLTSDGCIRYNEQELDKRIDMSRKWLVSAIEKQECK